ncbi:MAG: glycogen/starch/alpha-glucan phosphorylase, partial [Helcococcus sp.]|nr:glycogen/starch/alpha-glucan phosphorylase [Helcococcus sp.]
SKGEIYNAYNDVNRANSIVEFLYPSEVNLSGKKLRLTQEIFFASACIQDILKKYKKYMSTDYERIHEFIKIQINDIHPAFAQIFFIYYLTKKYNIEFEKALSIS